MPPRRWRRLTLPSAGDAPAGTRLKRSLGRLDLTAMGVGTIVGSGIFVSTGVAAATKAGPAIVLSFVLAGVICVLIALCYSEMAAMVPVSGSAYTYTYATLGETAGFLVGWNLALEFVVAGAAVAIGWSALFGATLTAMFGVTLPVAITTAPSDGGVINLPAVLIIAAVVAVLAGQVKLTARVTQALVVVTIGALAMIVAIGTPHFHSANWAQFAPFGIHGIIGGAALAFFAFLGFDVVATSAEETRRPQRDVPFAIITSVVIAAILYIAVSAVLTGVARYSTLDNAAPVATAFNALNVGWIGTAILAASVIALTKGLLMVTYGQTRLVFAMCRDGLLPPALATTSRRSGTPVRVALLLGAMGAVIAGLTPISVVVELVNVGALFAFTLVAIGVLVLRRIEPARERPFRTPLMPVVPVLAVAGCVALATTLAPLTWLRFVIWVAAGLAVYSLYGRRHSVLAATAAAAAAAATAAAATAAEDAR
jgi:APA family basic amino acid/polyamine antiporter